jgi:hypothetical protein
MARNAFALPVFLGVRILKNPRCRGARCSGRQPGMTRRSCTLQPRTGTKTVVRAYHYRRRRDARAPRGRLLKSLRIGALPANRAVARPRQTRLETAPHRAPRTWQPGCSVLGTPPRSPIRDRTQACVPGPIPRRDGQTSGCSGGLSYGVLGLIISVPRHLLAELIAPV